MRDFWKVLLYPDVEQGNVPVGELEQNSSQDVGHHTIHREFFWSENRKNDCHQIGQLLQRYFLCFALTTQSEGVSEDTEAGPKISNR